MVEGEELGAIARRVIDSNQFMTIGTADEEWVSRSRHRTTTRRGPGGADSPQPESKENSQWAKS